MYGRSRTPDLLASCLSIESRASNDLFRKRSLSLNSIYSIRTITNKISKSNSSLLDLTTIKRTTFNQTDIHNGKSFVATKMDSTGENNDNNIETSFCFKRKESDDGSIPHRVSLSPVSNTPVTEISSRGFADNEHIRVPIVGYEIMEERARFTVFKLRVENPFTNDCWLVLRRYTDFVRLNNKLKTMIPNNLTLPRKKLFGNNFGGAFLENRVKGLQFYINAIMANTSLTKLQIVRDFFCLDEPPTYSDSVEECRAIFEAQEETIAHLKLQLKDKEDTIAVLKENLTKVIHDKSKLQNAITKVTESCTKCSLDIDDYLQGNADII